MPKETQSYLDDESVDDILSTVDQFIEGVYRDLNLTPQHNVTARNSNSFQSRHSLNDSASPNVSPVREASILSCGDDSRIIVSPSTRMNMEAEIERINRMCDNVDRNLRSIGVFMKNPGNSNSSKEPLNTNITSSTPLSTNLMSDLSLDNSQQRTAATSSSSEVQRQTNGSVITEAANPVQIIDLSETQVQAPLDLDNSSNNNNNHSNGDIDDDVILVSADINPVVDLCTPGSPKATSRRRRRLTTDSADFSRRRLPVPDVVIVGTCDVEDNSSTARKRRSGIKRCSLNTLTTGTEYNNTKNESDSSGNKAPGPIPYMCSVCMESCLPRQPTSTKCGHIFCNECIRQAIQITHKCPMCNTRISRQHIFRIYP